MFTFCYGIYCSYSRTTVIISHDDLSCRVVVNFCFDIYDVFKVTENIYVCVCVYVCVILCFKLSSLLLVALFA